MEQRYTIGLDYGSLSCRGVLVCAEDGCLLAEEEFTYPHGVLYDALPDGTRLPRQWASAVPQDGNLNAAERGASSKSPASKPASAFQNRRNRGSGCLFIAGPPHWYSFLYWVGFTPTTRANRRLKYLAS